MANLSITAGNVLPSTGAVTESGYAGATITAGQPVYKKSTDNKFYLTDCDATAVSGNAEIDNVYGIALNGASTGQPIVVQTSGDITIGATLTIGKPYCVSATAGSICLWSDLVSTDWVSLIGIGKTTGIIKMGIDITGVQIPA